MSVERNQMEREACRQLDAVGSHIDVLELEEYWALPGKSRIQKRKLYHWIWHGTKGKIR
jgi:hypothetical protein